MANINHCNTIYGRSSSACHRKNSHFLNQTMKLKPLGVAIDNFFVEHGAGIRTQGHHEAVELVSQRAQSRRVLDDAVGALQTSVHRRFWKRRHWQMFDEAVVVDWLVWLSWETRWTRVWILLLTLCHEDFLCWAVWWDNKHNDELSGDKNFYCHNFLSQHLKSCQFMPTSYPSGHFPWLRKYAVSMYSREWLLPITLLV